ncbi:hypothetical protein EXIGLDRAFT_840533 [Exidia glandulosa HHB12029]|uniref:Uncharacterized protein n=1 Tax=Exidia glandulosa HHB12029 TaxID=1314781 RepID=A0A165ZY27_EXIGL|nr:hypothetical protein EXIGLDRAFT_840533 [Exidia glandulosa HHB12029]
MVVPVADRAAMGCQDDLRRKVMELSDAYRTVMNTRPQDAESAYGAWLAAFHTVPIVRAAPLRPAPNLNHCTPESRARMRRAFEKQRGSAQSLHG